MGLALSGDTYSWLDATSIRKLAELRATVPAPGQTFVGSATFTPAATSHVAGDCFGAAQDFALGAPSGATLRIESAQLEIDGSAETTAWRAHLFNITPPSAVADDGAFLLAAGDRASYLGWVDFIQTVNLGSTQYIEATPNKQIKLLGTSVFGYLVNGTTLTPGAVAHKVFLQTRLVS